MYEEKLILPPHLEVSGEKMEHEPVLLTVSYKRDYSEEGVYLGIYPGGPIITSKAMLYVLTNGQLKRAKDVELESGLVLRLSKRIPKGALFAPIRYNREKRSYVAPAIGRIVAVMPTWDLEMAYDAYFEVFSLTDIEANEDENIERIKEVYGNFEVIEMTEDEIRTQIRNVLKYRHLLRDVLGRAPEHVRRFLSGEGYDIEGGGYILILAETLVCFVEDTGVKPVDAPTLERDFIAQLLSKPQMSHRAYTGELRSLRAFVGEDACRVIRHLLRQRLPCL